MIARDVTNLARHDIRMLAIHADEGIEGVITGRAIYDGRLDVRAAIEMAART